ncbi:EAL domain-containing protein [Aliikangiella marina]|uniref:EAL domain-containing protein n=1 Tax=Aliikangiella marina TaxID=1712262 RepID=A0A545TA42_9GAMM|nr:EAL domain-containing protein [Aliikangiella marina]TQV74081.1 EAL domain-containing protein [Aliikangiella marina]
MSRIFRSLFAKLHFKFLVRSIFVLTLGVATFETASFYQMSKMLRELTVQNVRVSVEQASNQIENELSQLSSDVEIIGSLPALESYYLNLKYGLDREAEEYLNSVITFFNNQSVRNPAYIGLKICDLNGGLLASQYISNEVTNDTLKTVCQLADHENNFLYPSQRFIEASENSSRPLFIYSQVIRRAQEQLGIIEVFYDLTDYFKHVDNTNINNSGYLAVVDLGSKPLSTNQPNRVAEINALKLSQFKTENNFTSLTLQPNKDIILYKNRLKSIDWRIIGVIDESEVFAPLFRQAKFAIWLIIAMIVTEVLFLSFFTKRLITTRINSLLEATKNILSGNYDLRVSEHSNDEISELSQSFNQMTNSLQEKISQLEIERHNLDESRQQLKNILDNSSAIVNIKNTTGEYRLVNNAFLDFFQLSESEIIGKTDFQLLDTQLAREFQKNDEIVIENNKPMSFEEDAVHADGNQHTFIAVKFPLKNKAGNIYAICSIATDITERKAEEKALQELNAKLSLSDAVIENIIEGIVITDPDFNIIDMNPAFERLFGYSRAELLGNKPSIIRSDYHDENFFDELYSSLQEKGNWHGEIWEKTKDGSVVPQLLTVTSIKDSEGKVTHYTGIYADITDLKETEAELQKLAHFDSLTGLPNRVLLEERTSQAILRAKRGNYNVTMLFIDLDNFKYINDTLGHDVGDELLKSLAERFNQLLRSTDTLARLGGDEFVLLLSQTHHPDDAGVIASKLKAAASQPFNINEHELYVSTSIGIAVFPDDALTTGGLLKCADMAMYAAKESGKNNFHFFSEKLNHAAVDRLRTEKALRAAIEDDALELYYQPQISPRDNSTIKVEALLRWRNQGEFVPPDLFVPIAEESGLIVVLGEWIVERAIKDLKVINQNCESPIGLSINLSARQFRHHDLAKTLASIVNKAGIAPSLVEFEITEGLLVDDFKLAEKILYEIRDFGFSIALDDFGKGYSSLSYLKYFPIDTLKLDRVFMTDLTNDQRTQAIVEASVSMGQALGMKVVCEGVETKSQFDFVKAIGDVSIQGYYCSRALPVEELIRFITKAVA